MSRVLLLGAEGFIGRHVLSALLDDGHVVVGVRRQVRPHDSRGGQMSWREANIATMTAPEHWRYWLVDVDVVINCAGILRQRLGERYDDLHHRVPAAIAQACAAATQSGATVRFIHTSALGLHEGAKSRFLSSKLLGEQAVQRSHCDHCVVRPSLIDGLGGFGASWLRMLASWPVHFVPRGAVGQIAAVRASDLAMAYASLAAKPSLINHREANLGGTRLFAYAQYLQMLRGVERDGAKIRAAWQIPMPNWVMRMGAHLCDVGRFSPFSYGHWILLQRDNVPRPNHLPELLGRPPEPVEYERVRLADDFRMS